MNSTSVDGELISPGFREECAVVGIWNDPEAARMAFLGLYAQQHRGQESSGLVSCDQGRFLVHKGMGLVGDVFPEAELARLTGRGAIGHNRYSTTGANAQYNIQPLSADLRAGTVALAHNGNIVNAGALRDQLKQDGAIFQGTNDTECLLHLLARVPGNDIITGLKEILPLLEGAYSLVLMTPDRLIAARDPHGFRPLVLGLRPVGDGSFSFVVASETCAFDLIGAKLTREIEPGELVWFDDQGEHRDRIPGPPRKLAKCVFEHVYFARPDSQVFGLNVYESRKRMGERLALENPVEADMVVPVPDSGLPAAIGYARASGIPFELGIIRNHYIGRTFIQPSQSIRNFGVKIKLNPQTEVLKGKRVVVVDDSLVRGTTSQKIIRLIRAAGATAVHFRIASPPTTGPCYYGVDTPGKAQLIAAQHTTEEIRQFIDADSLAYLTVDGMMEAVRGSTKDFCAACFSGEYPTPVEP